MGLAPVELRPLSEAATSIYQRAAEAKRIPAAQYRLDLAEGEWPRWVPEVEELLGHGLLRLSGDEQFFDAQDPEEVAAEGERRAVQLAMFHLAGGSALREMYSQLQSLYVASEPGAAPELTQYVVGEAAIGRRLQSEVTSATKRVFTVQPGSLGPRPGERLMGTMPMERALMNKGVQRRMLYQDPARAHVDTHTFVQLVTDLGAEVRTATYLPLRVFILDDLVVYPKSGQLTIAVFNREPSVVGLVSDLFDHWWEQATTFLEETTPALAQGGGLIWATLTPEQRRVGEFVVQRGLTVAQVATRTGWSSRTVNRHLEALRIRYAAMSTAHLGWLMAQDHAGSLVDGAVAPEAAAVTRG